MCSEVTRTLSYIPVEETEGVENATELVRFGALIEPRGGEEIPRAGDVRLDVGGGLVRDLN